MQRRSADIHTWAGGPQAAAPRRDAGAWEDAWHDHAEGSRRNGIIVDNEVQFFCREVIGLCQHAINRVDDRA